MSGKSAKKFGQAATELAVFGGIIIFLVGGIVRAAVSSSYQQNTQLKAMRAALLESYRNSVVGQGVGRNSASVIYIEDRISPDVTKYGSLERIPFVASGAGTLSNMLMFPLDLVDLTPGEQQNKNINLMDVFVNGKHFTFSTSALSGKNFGPPAGFSAFYPNGSEPDPANNGTHHYKGWNFQCVAGDGGYYGCPIFYQIVANPGDGSGDKGILSDNESFNLNRSDDFTDNPPPATIATPTMVKPGVQFMAWQWKGSNGVKGAFTEPDPENSNYPSYDVDNDLSEETVYTVNFDGRGVATSAVVLDGQDGDIDAGFDQFTALRNNGGVPLNRPGLQNDMGIYTQTAPGTFLQIKEGKLFNPETGAFVRSVSKRDQVEVIRRQFQLSNNTGRMCNGGVPLNGVEMCNNCSSDISKTCYDETLKMLYVSSRIEDKRGRFWRTDLSGGLP